MLDYVVVQDGRVVFESSTRLAAEHFARTWGGVTYRFLFCTLVPLTD